MTRERIGLLGSRSYVLHVPGGLGGGEIIEQDYTPDRLTQIVLGRLLSDNPEDVLWYNTDSTTPHYAGLPMNRLLEQRLALAEANRLTLPIHNFIDAKHVLGHELSEHELLFMGRRQLAEAAIADITTEISKPYHRVKEEEAREIAEQLKAAAEGERRIRASEELIQHAGARIIRISTEFTPEYKVGSVGRHAVRFLEGKTDFADDQGVFAGVAALDVLPYAASEQKDLHRTLVDIAYSTIGIESTRIAAGSRLGKSRTAHPRHTTGDGKEVISRSNPGV